MDNKIEVLDDCNVIYVRNKGKYGSNRNYEMMKNFKEWIKENCYWRYVETNGILGVALDDPQIVEEESCRYDLVLKIDEDVKINDFINSRSFTGGKYVVFALPHTTKDVKDFYSNLPNIIDNNNLRVKNEPILERYKEEEGKDKYCEVLIPIL